MKLINFFTQKQIIFYYFLNILIILILNKIFKSKNISNSNSSANLFIITILNKFL